MEMTNQHRGDGLVDALASQLLETYSPTPMRLLHMWRQAKKNDGAFFNL